MVSNIFVRDGSHLPNDKERLYLQNEAKQRETVNEEEKKKKNLLMWLSP